MPSPFRPEGAIPPRVSPTVAVPPAATTITTKANVAPFQTGLPLQPLVVTTNKGHETHHHTAPSLSATDRLNKVVWGLGLMLAGLALHKLPPVKHASFQFFSTDPKDYIRATLGVAAVGKFNTAADLKLPPWLLGLETVTAIAILSNGSQKKLWRHFPLLAVFVPLLVQGTHELIELTNRALDKQQSTLPKWVPQLGISTLTTIAGVLGLRGIMNTQQYVNFVGKTFGADAAVGITGAEAVVCARCSGNHLICVTEVTDMVGSLAAWFRQKMGQPTLTPQTLLKEPAHAHS